MKNGNGFTSKFLAHHIINPETGEVLLFKGTQVSWAEGFEFSNYDDLRIDASSDELASYNEACAEFGDLFTEDDLVETKGKR